MLLLLTHVFMLLSSFYFCTLYLPTVSLTSLCCLAANGDSTDAAASQKPETSRGEHTTITAVITMTGIMCPGVSFSSKVQHHSKASQ